MTETPDQLTIDTPEQVAIRFPIAGIGSRFLAILGDTVLQVLAYAAVVLLIYLVVSAVPGAAHSSTATPGASTPTSVKWFIAGIIFFHFLMYWGYFTLFEAFWNGQTPGKRWCKLRVIRDSGRQITLFESMTRNLVRIVDWMPGIYAVGLIAMLCNRRNKRLGDLAAGTLVVHERAIERPIWGGSATRTFTAAAFADAAPIEPVVTPLAVDIPADAVARLSSDDLNLIDHFFARAIDIDISRREPLARRLVLQMSGKMGIALPDDLRPERILESIARILRGIQR
ncbi:MAG TPA: RDD family protein [Acidobacteriaceae bacterium]|nr:RDD family protein [Acidobacteriaceae bacterium]